MLPPIDRQRELSNASFALFMAISWDDLQRVRSRLGQLHRGGFKLREAVLRVDELREFLDVEDSAAFAGLSDSEEMSAVAFAQRLGHSAALEVLQSDTEDTA